MNPKEIAFKMLKPSVFGMGESFNPNSISLYSKVDLSESYLSLEERKRLALRYHIVKDHGESQLESGNAKEVIHIDPNMNGVAI